MDNSVVSLIISGFALLVSIISGAYQIYRSNKEAALQREVTRSSLLTEILHSTYNYQKHRRVIKRLLSEAKQNNRTDLIQALEEINKQNYHNEKVSFSTYEKLCLKKDPKPEFLEIMRHFVEAMNHQSKEVTEMLSKYHIE